MKGLAEGLRAAVRFVQPSTQLLLREFNDIDGADAHTRRQCEEIRDTRDRLAELLANEEGTANG